jgi:Uma2 family endonuclease
MALAEQLPRRRFTAEEVWRMIETGVLSEDEPLELLEGELVVVTPQGPIHQTLSERTRRLLERAFGEGVHGHTHSTIDAGHDDLPEPDVVILRGGVDDYLDRLPTASDILLIVEISRTSLREDRGKARIYSRAGVAVYWLVNLPAQQVEVYSGPSPNGEYAEPLIYGESDEVPVPGTEAHLAVRDLLP